MAKTLTIGQLAKVTGVPTRTIRHYEAVGTLPIPQRSGAGYRLYTEADVRRLEIIRRARALDMSLPEAAELVRWAGSKSCGDFQDGFREVVRGKLEHVDRRIADLRRLKQDLQDLEIHLMGGNPGDHAVHTMMDCSPDTCTCMGERKDNLLQIQGASHA